MSMKLRKGKIFALILTFAMVLNLFTVPAYAKDASNEGQVSDLRANLSFVYLGKTATAVAPTTITPSDVPSGFSLSGTETVWIGLQLSNLSKVKDLFGSDKRGTADGGVYTLQASMIYDSNYLQPLPKAQLNRGWARVRDNYAVWNENKVDGDYNPDPGLDNTLYNYAQGGSSGDHDYEADASYETTSVANPKELTIDVALNEAMTTEDTPRLFHNNQKNDGKDLGDDAVILMMFPFQVKSGVTWPDADSAPSTPLLQGGLGQSSFNMTTGATGLTSYAWFTDMNSDAGDTNLKRFFNITDSTGQYPSDGTVPLVPGAETNINYDPTGNGLPTDGTGSLPTDSTSYSNTFNMGGTIEMLPVPTTTTPGYAFTGWNTKLDGTGIDIDSTVPINSAMLGGDTELKLYAQWDNVNLVTIDGNGDDASTTKTYSIPASGANNTINSIGESVPVLSRAGYDFNGWYKATTDGANTIYNPVVENLIAGKDDDAGDVAVDVNNAGTWFADWTATTDPVTVTFDDNNGNNSYAQRTVKKGDPINNATDTVGKNMPAEPTRTGYQFAGWNTKPNGSGVDFDGTTEVNDAILTDNAVTVYAQWTVADEDNPWTVTFEDGFDEAVLDITPSEYKVPSNAGDVPVTAALVPDPPVNPGMSFIGWYVSVGGAPIDVTTSPRYDGKDSEGHYTYKISDNTTVMAGWAADANVNLHMCDATDSTGTDPVAVKGYVGQKIEDMEGYSAINWDSYVKYQKGYQLIGWGTSSRADAPEGYTEDDLLQPGAPFTTDVADASGTTELYAWWKAVVDIDAESTNLVYTGSALDWQASLKFVALTFEGTDYDNADEPSKPINLTASTDGTTADYSVVWQQSGTEVTSLLNAGTYDYTFTADNPEIYFVSSTGSIDVAKMKVKLHATDSKGTTDGSVGSKPKPTMTVVDDEGSLSDEMKADILNNVELGYYLLPEGQTTIDAGDWTDRDDGHEVGNYFITVGMAANSNYELDTTPITGLTQVSETSTPINVTADAMNQPPLNDPNKPVYLFTVDWDSWDVSFKNITSMTDTTPVDVVTKKVKNNKNIDDEGTTDTPGMPANPTKFDNAKFVGWVPGADYATALAAYDAWVADQALETPTGVADPRFTATTPVTEDVTLFAVWKTSDDATLKPPVTPPTNPEDPVTDGGLVLMGKTQAQKDAAEAGTAITTKDSTYATAKPFDPTLAADQQEYWARVANNIAYLDINYDTAEEGSIVKVYKKDNTEIPDTSGGVVTESLVSMYVVGADKAPTFGSLETFKAGGRADIPLEAAVNASTNDFRIEVTAPDTSSTAEYKIHVQRMNVARIELAYGNSPVGMIMNSSVVAEEDKEAAKEAFIASGDTSGNYSFKSLDAKFVPTDQFAGDPDNANVNKRHYMDAVKSVYTSSAWDTIKDAENNPKNYDLDEYSIFVYYDYQFQDPGFKAYDELGNDVTATSANASGIEDVVTMTGLVTPAYGEAEEGTKTLIERGENGVYDLTGKSVRTDVYEITYTYTYTPTGETDPVTISKTRPVIILGKRGDFQMSPSPVVNNLDATAIDGRWTNMRSLLSNYTNSGKKSGLSLFLFRVGDCSESNPPVVNNLDATWIDGRWQNSKQEFIQFYNILPVLEQE